MNSIRRIAVLRALFLGDLLVSVPALRALRTRFPDAEITLIGLPWAKTFVQRFRHLIDRFVEFPGYPGLQEVPYEQQRTEHFFAEQRCYGYDLAIQMHGSGRTSNPFVADLQAHLMAGAYEGKKPDYLTYGLPYSQTQHEIWCHLRLVELLGCVHLDTQLEFPLFETDYAEATTLLQQLPEATRPWIALHAGSHALSRRWPADYFARVGDLLNQQYGAQIILTGGPEEVEIAQSVSDVMQAPALNLAGQTSLGGLAALLSKVNLFVSNDTGPAHVAHAIQSPCITIFGPVDPDRWAPLDQVLHPIVRHAVPCSPCGYAVCPIDHRCMRWLTPGVVLQVAQRFLSSGDYRHLTPYNASHNNV